MAISVLPHKDELGIKEGRQFIDGEWVDGTSGEAWTHIHPATNEECGTFSIASPEDVNRAVAAARRAFDDGDWPKMKAKDRIRLLRRVSELFSEHADELNRIQTFDNGLPISFGNIYQVSAEFGADAFDHHAGWIDKITGETVPTYTGSDFQILTLKEPVGVVAAVIPWNAPVMLFAQKVAPALATGCTVVLKPSEFASFSVIRMAQFLEEAGVPKGVFNLVLGPGTTTGEALITNPDVEKITFTGSRLVGKRIMAAASERIARVSLELGGKSPNIIFDDVDVGSVAATAMGMVSMGLSGQGCVCHTRALVQESIYDDLINAATAMAGISTFGDPFDPTVTSGALINRRQLDKVVGYIEQGTEEGGRLVCGGDRPGGDLADGNFVNPTLFADVDNSMTIAREEIFGPVLAAIPFRDEDEAIRIANDTSYGLGASVHTNDTRRAFRVAKAVRAGSFGINGYTVMPNAPFGGFKESGLGREGGRQVIEEFLETKTVTIALTDSPI